MNLFMKKIAFLIFLFLIGSLTIESQQMKGREYNLMPMPLEISEGTGNFEINSNFTVGIKGPENESSRISNAAVRFLRYLTNKTGVFIDEGFAKPVQQKNAEVSLLIGFSASPEVVLGVDESYELEVKQDRIEIRAATDIGAMHALSTLLQLLTVDEGRYVIPGVLIKDAPRFVWRGLMMDVARHFMPVEVVKRNLDAMAFVKLNVFHWHLSDDQGFRLEVESLPNLHEKASDGQYYTQDQIRDIVHYASERGIRVVPEFDVPGHATAILTAYPEFASKKGIDYKLERYAGIFDPTLDPTNEQTYEFLDTLFKEIAPLFPDRYFHIGGDENEGKHWDENESIQKFMKDNDLGDNHELQTFFNIKLEKILARYGKSLMGWEEIMTKNMPKTALIHSWKGVNEGMEPGESLIKAVKNGYQTILSNGYYIDLMLSVEDHYLVDPMPQVALSEEEANRILGGEATMWSELVTPLTVDSRIWPRTAAIAERFWSPRSVTDVDDMFRRLEVISNSMELMGLRHLQSREYLLRNISNYQDVQALRDLSHISEPFKIYSRNAGGTQYKSFSPFTLFADACVADAGDVRQFRRSVKKFILAHDQQSRQEVMDYLERWSGIYGKLDAIRPNAPLLSPLMPYAKRVRDISELMIVAMNSDELSQENMKKLQHLLKSKEDPENNLDVDLAVIPDLMDLADFLLKK